MPEKGKPVDRFPVDFRYVDVGGVGKGDPVKVVKSDKAPSRARQFISAGDTLFSNVRVNLRRTLLVEDEQADVASTAFCVLRPGPEIDPVFLHQWVNTDFFLRWLLPLQRGGTPPAVLDKDVKNQLIPVPPIQEQQNIVARIDELITELEDGEAALERTRHDLETYRKSLLKAAVTGALTADWRAANHPQETGEQLLQRLKDDRLAVWSARPENAGKKFKGARVGELVDEQRRRMWEIPSSWTWMQLGHLAFVTKLAGFEYTKFVTYDDDGDLNVIKAENAGPNGFKPTKYSRVRSENVSQLTRSKLSGGDLLMAFVGSVGNVARVPNEGRFFLGPNIAMMRLETSLVEPEFVEIFLRSPLGRALALSLSKAVAQASLSMGTIRQIPVALPPIEEQREIVARLKTELEALAEAVAEEAILTKKSDQLRQSILTSAFKGELIK